MKIGRFEIINIEKRVKEIYYNRGGFDSDRKEVAYAGYRVITRANIQESHVVVKKWIKGWEGEKK